jgi:transcriptional regulator with XRE-family HTH domain
VDDALYVGDLDLGSVTTREDLAGLLRTVHIRADKPSLRTLEARTRHSSPPLSKTVTAEMLKGARFPRKAVMVAFLQACGVPEDAMESWRRAWERVATREEAPVSPQVAPATSDLHAHPEVAEQHSLSVSKEAAAVVQAGRVDADETAAASTEPAETRQLRKQVDRLTSDNEALRAQLAAMREQAVDDPPPGSSDNNEGPQSPALCRRELGTLLRDLRIQAGMTVEQVAERLMCSQNKVRRMENSFRAGTVRDVRDLCDLYQVTEIAERDHLMELARASKQRGWQQSYPLGFSTYLELEAGASSIKTYESAIMPGLVQTADYARAVFESYASRLSSEVIEQRIEGRLARQRRLTAADPPRVRFILDEAALHRVIGRPTVMMAQLDQLIEVARLPNVTVQIIPYGIGAHQAIDSNFAILEFAAHAGSVVYAEGLVSDLFLERPRDIEQYQLIFEELCSISLGKEESVVRIMEIAGNLYNRRRQTH